MSADNLKNSGPDFTVVIPARYGSERLPGKPLLEIAGKPMLWHTWQQARRSAASAVVIATDDERIAAAATDFGAQVCMTAATHQSGTDRLEEVARLLTLEDDAIVVNVQGDEPRIPPEVIDQVARNLAQHSSAGIATLAEDLEEYQTWANPNAVKVVASQSGFALYFSRAQIPWNRDQPELLPTAAPVLRHIGIYAYRAAFLKQFVTWPQSPLEKTEKLEQLRALENGVAIHVERACAEVPAGVDTQADLDRLRGNWS